MSDSVKTAVFGAVAGILAVAALFSVPRHKPAEVFSLEGRPFYPDFVDPSKAASLEVVDYEESTGSARLFKVELKNGKWVIPSHHDYPADAKDRLKNTAALVLGLKRDVFRSQNPKDHESFGVIDPLDSKVETLKGRGKRVKIADGQGQILADFIFGKDAGEGKRFARLPGQKHAFAVKTKGEISARFEDWIETDLLQVSQHTLRKVLIDSYSIDEKSGQIKNRVVHQLARENSSDPWKLNEIKETEEVNADTVSGILSALDDLKIVGVRPKPQLLAEEIRATGDFRLSKRVTQAMMQSLQSLQQKGYYFLRQGDEFHMVSNEGELQAGGEDGIVYSLRFGEVLVGEGEELTAGTEAPKKEGKKDEKKGGTESRHLFVIAKFDPALLGAPPVEPKAPEGTKPEEKKDEKKPEGTKPEEKKQDSPEVEKYKKDKEEYDRKKKEHEKKIEDGQKRAKELSDRFADWYYVISADLFKKLRQDRAGLVKAKEKKEEEKKPDEKKPEEPKKPEEKKPEEPKPAEKKPEAPKPEEPKPAEKKP